MVFAAKVVVMAVAPIETAALSVLIVPASVIADGAIAVNAAPKLSVPPLAPSVKVPVLLKVTALVIVPLVPLSATLYAWAAVLSVVAVNAPLKVIVPTVLVSVTVVALTVLLKVVPPE